MDILENMRKMLEAGKISKEDIERAFPELKESEDERIRKEIIDFLKVNGGVVTPKAWIDYLGKQKEQAADEKYAGMVVVSQEEWDAAIAEAFKIGRDEGERQRKQQPAEWSEEDKELLDALMDMVANSLYEPLCPRVDMLVWLRALRSRPKSSDNWKPSEEQMEALSWAINYLMDIEQGCASTLALLKFNLKELI